jgi:ABC-type multidrug transport system ATPase subunit
VRAGRQLVVEGLDFSAATGVTGLLGRNGAGKTTLLRALATVLPPAAGELSLFGSAVGRRRGVPREIRARIGYAPQANTVLGHLTVLEQVTYAGWLKGLAESEARRRAGVAVERVDLGREADRRTRKLSGGMLRRLAVAMAIVSEPELILLDEPTAGLDPQQRVVFRELVAELGRTSAVILSTHLIEDVVAVCDQITVIRNGRAVFTGGVDRLAGVLGDRPVEGMSRPEAAFLRLTEAAGA